MSRIIVTLCVAMSAYAPAETNSVASKVIVDANSGQHAEVDAKKEVVSLYDKDGKVVWSNNVVDSVKMSVGTNTNMLHQVGGKIHSIQLYKDGLWIGVGRGYAILDIKTGNFKGTASR